jgi:hypothetical protein
MDVVLLPTTSMEVCLHRPNYERARFAGASNYSASELFFVLVSKVKRKVAP